MTKENDKQSSDEAQETEIPQSWINEFYEKISIPGEFEPKPPKGPIKDIRVTATEGINILFADIKDGDDEDK